MKHFFDNLSLIGTRYNLSFTAQELLHDGILGLDGIRRKLVILGGLKTGTITEYVVDLDDIKGCSLKKEYGKIDANALRSRNLEHYLKRISLLIDAKQGARKEILFYQQDQKSSNGPTGVEAKARKWKTILSKLAKPVRKKAIDKADPQLS